MRMAGLWLCMAVMIVAGCTSGPPQAPSGWSKRPANSPDTIAGLLRETAAPQPVASPAPSPAPTHSSVPGPPAAAVDFSVIVVSDFSAPGGPAGLPALERMRLVAQAQKARSVLLYCRGDQLRPSRRGFRALIRRGLQVKRFLVDAGVAPAKIHVFARSAGDFIADINTPSGRARNRRVEIHFA